KKVQLASAIQKIEFDSTLSEVERTVLVLLAQSKLFTESIEDKLEDRDIIAMAKETSHSQNAVQKAIKELEEQGKIDLLQKRPLIHDISNEYI
ncbi:MAG: hypothetical protein WAZ49_05225, partial [Lactococcus raffinolactis]